MSAATTTTLGANNNSQHHGRNESVWSAVGSVEDGVLQTAPQTPLNGSLQVPAGYPVGGDKWGKEPAVKKCGFMTIPAFTKMVRE